MPSYSTRRSLAPPRVRETLEEVKARLIEELKERTEERVRRWQRLSDWCEQRPGRYLRIDWLNRGGESSSDISNNSNADDGAGISSDTRNNNLGNNINSVSGEGDQAKFTSVVEQPD